MLNAHPTVAVPHEMDYFHKAIPLSVLRRWKNPDLAPADFEQMIDRWLTNRRHVFKDVGLNVVRQAILEGPRNARSPFRIAMETWANHYGKSQWGAKTPRNLFFVDLIAEMFPQARFIYLARDPRAVVRSMNEFEFFSDDSVINAFNWRVAATEGWELLTTSVPENQRYLLHYESLVADPDTALRDLCRFLDIPFAPQMLDFHKGPRAAFPETVRTSTIRQPVTDASISKWRSDLSVDEIAAVETICDKPMRRLGYEPTDLTLSLRGQFNLALKSIYWTWKKHRAAPQRGFTIKYKPFLQFRSR